jgi:hypothetical protein
MLSILNTLSSQGSSAKRVRIVASLSASTTSKTFSPSPSLIGPPRTTNP